MIPRPFPQGLSRLVAGALVLCLGLPSAGWARPGSAAPGTLKVATPREGTAEAGLEEALATGAEEPQTVEAAMGRWFGPNADRAGEVALEHWLRRQGEAAIHEFMRLVADDRGVSVEALGPYAVEPRRIAVAELERRVQEYAEVNPGALADETTAHGRVTPESSYEYERLKLMAAVAIQRALGRQVIVEIGMGYVGIASSLVHANTIADPQQLPLAPAGRRFRSPIRQDDMHPWFVISFQRPSASLYKVFQARQGIVPLPTSDPSAPELLRQGLDHGTLLPTPLMEGVAVADLVLSETELQPLDRSPDDPLAARIDETTTLSLLDRVAGLVHSPETALVIISTVTPGFTERAARQVAGRARVYHAPTRLQPGATWTRWLEFPRLAAAAKGQPKAPLEAYLEILYREQNRRHFGITGAPPPGGRPYMISPDAVSIEVEKSWENFWRNRLMELGVLLLQLGDELGLNAWALARGIAEARPATHGSADVIAQLVGGFCVTNQHKQLLTGLMDELRQRAPNGQFAELELQRYFRSALAATLVLADRARDLVLDYLWPALERVERRPDRIKVLLGGVAYREGTDETRQSGPEAVARHLRDLGGSDVQVFSADPRVRYWAELAEQDLSHPGRLGYGMRHQEALRHVQVASDLLQELLRRQPDVVLMTTRHREYLGARQPAEMRADPATGRVVPGLDPIEVIVHAYARDRLVLGDTFNFFSDQDLSIFLAHGWEVFGLGKGHIRTQLAPQVTDRHRLAVAERVLTRLQQKRGDPQFDATLLEAALVAQTLRVAAWRAAVTSGLEEAPDVARARVDLASTRLELLFVGGDPDRRALLEARAAALGEAVRALGATGRLDDAAARAQAAYVQQRAAHLRGGAAHVRDEVVQPALAGVGHDMSALVQFLNALLPSLQDPQELLLPGPAPSLGQVAQHLQMIGWDTRQLRRTAERLMRELLPPAGQQALAHRLRVAAIPADLAFPAPRPPAVQDQLKDHYRAALPDGEVMMPADDRVLFLPATIYVPDHPGPGGRFVRRTALDEGTMVASVKFAPDLAWSDPDLRAKEWGKHHLQVRANEVPVEVVEVERFPDFQGLPLEFRLYFEDLIRRGRILSTLDGDPQDRFGFVMPINLAPGTPNHRRGRMAFLYFTDDRRPLVGVNPTNHTPFIVEWKGTGLHMGGSPAALTPKVAELRAGRQAGGGVGRQTAVQIPGHMGSGEEVLTLARLRLTEAYLRGDPAPPVPLARVRFRYLGDPSGAEYEVVLRGAPTSQRLGHRLVDGSGGLAAHDAARVFGQAAALLLALDPLNVHIALNGDNVYLNGYPTDTASQIDVPNERDPLGAFMAYFGYQLSHVLYGFEQIDAKDWTRPHTEYLHDWLEGFFSDLLRIQGRGQVAHPEPFQPFRDLTAETLARMADPETGLVEPLMRALWEYYVAYWVVESRVRRGYDPTRESAYTTNSDAKLQTKYRPQSRDHAKKFLQDQREVLTHARRLVEQEGYPPLVYVEGPRAGQPFDFDAALREISSKEAALDEMAGDYSAAYQLSVYPPLKPEYYTVVDPEGEERESVLLLRYGKGYEKPNAAVQAARRQESQAPAAAGLEEPGETTTAPTLAQWQAALQDPARGLEIMRQVYPHEVASEKLPLWQGWMRAVAAARAAERTDETRQPAFDPALPMTVAWTPGRAALPLGGRHVDYLGFMGGSLGFPILEGIGLFVQEVAGLRGAVEVYGLGSPAQEVMQAYPEGRPRTVSLQASWMQPPESLGTVPEWDRWAGQIIRERLAARPAGPDGQPDGKLNYADDLIAGALAFLRTPLGDPSGAARRTLDRLAADGAGLRIAIVGDLPPGGQSTSSAIVMGITQALNRQYGWELSTDQMVHVGYAERVWAGTQGGVKDHATMMNPPAFLGVSPVRVIAELTLPSSETMQVMSFDTGISRDQAPRLSERMRQPGHSAADITGRTGIGYALGVLWLRQHHPELAAALGPYDDPANPYGFGRELLPGGRAGLTPAELLPLLREIPEEGLSREALRAALPHFAQELDQLFAREPALPDGVARPPYRVRKMLQFGMMEEARSLLTVDILQRLRAGELTDEAAFQRLLAVARAAHHGDRLVRHDITLNDDGHVVGIQPRSWNPRTSDAKLDGQIARGEAFTLEDLALGRAGDGHLERSLEPIDLLVDLIEAFNRGHPAVREAHRGTAAGGVIVGAGLGGTVTVLVRPEYARPLQEFLQREYYDRLALAPQPPIMIEPGNPSTVLALSPMASPAAGLEALRRETPATIPSQVMLKASSPEGDRRELQPIAEAIRQSLREMSGLAIPAPDARLGVAAGLEERAGPAVAERIALRPGVTAGHVVLLAPAMATQPILQGFALMDPPDGESHGLVVFARDQQHADELTAYVAEAGLRLLGRVVNVKDPPYRGDIDAILAAWKTGYQRDRVEVVTVRSLGDLAALETFWQIPPAKFQPWLEGVRQPSAMDRAA